MTSAADHLNRLANDETLTWDAYGYSVEAKVYKTDARTAAASAKALADELRANHGFEDTDDEEWADYTKTLWPTSSPERTDRIRELLRAAAERA